jgi:hypothetical protein
MPSKPSRPREARKRPTAIELAISTHKGMSMTPDPKGTTNGVTCAQCGAAASPAQPTDEDDEPITHCEWCGAEYPIPDTATTAEERDSS